MINLVLNKEIRSRTTYEIPVLFGNPQMNKKKLYSYSVFNESICDEIIFDDKSVAKHIYDSNCFLKSSIMYNSENVIVKSLQFEFLDKDEKELFRLQGEISQAELLKLIGENKDK